MAPLYGYEVGELEDKYQDELYSVEKPQDIYAILSSVFSRVKDHYLSFFDKDQFKTIRVKTQAETMSEFKTFMIGVPKMKEKPIIIFDPDDIEIVEETIFSDVDMMRNRVVVDGNSGVPVYAIPFMDFSENVNGNTLGLLYRMNRYRIRTDVLMVLSGRAAQLNLYNHIVMNIRHKSMYTINESISYRLNKAILTNIARILKMDLASEEFLAVLNKSSIHPVRKLVYPNQMFDHYIEINVNMYVSIPDLPSIDNAGRNGMIEEAARIRTNIVVEADIPAIVQMLVSEKLLIDPVQGVQDNSVISLIPKPLPELTVPRKLGEFMNISVVDVIVDEKEYNRVSIYDLLEYGEEMNNFLKSKVQTLDQYIKFVVYEDHVFSDSTLDKEELVLSSPKMGKLYTIAIYINFNKINNEANAKLKKVIGTVKFNKFSE